MHRLSPWARNTGKLTLANHGASTIDVSITLRGYYAGDGGNGTGSKYVPTTPQKVVDTHKGIGVDGGGTAAITSGASLTLDPATSVASALGHIDAVALDINAQDSTQKGWANRYSAGISDPGISSVTFAGNGINVNGFDVPFQGWAGR
ncbi:MAG: hypothetical protein JWN52_4659 [Actinomycetia bacterium]|nr:hypothetical protein [Actinomycetes bacterium]